ncbi:MULTISPECIES: hypothetical protein [unclassified Caballeronia]|uniref:hypothetical protein n=1 Tax=unclassified Caballeronia TaxID=2646786 RepID=UPI001F3AC47F|nr:MULTISPECIES: hypothetical protein [unclassified Caballeronia]MCE4544572.1 hypothetical protein [Caballeronia sp. PC1]MCE4571724.1 hypothetical protein [Caballeronia sp. CLC5]
MSPRKDNLFADVLLACAMAPADQMGYFAAQDIRAHIQLITGKDYQIPSFSKHLKEFCEEKRGPILKKIGTARRFRFRFINPLAAVCRDAGLSYGQSVAQLKDARRAAGQGLQPNRAPRERSVQYGRCLEQIKLDSEALCFACAHSHRRRQARASKNAHPFSGIAVTC